MQFSSSEQAFQEAERLMRKGAWSQAEALIREFCTSDADLTLRLAQLSMRRACAEYANDMLDACSTYAEAFNKLEQEYDIYTCAWVLKEYGRENT